MIEICALVYVADIEAAFSGDSITRVRIGTMGADERRRLYGQLMTNRVAIKSRVGG